MEHLVMEDVVSISSPSSTEASMTKGRTRLDSCFQTASNGDEKTGKATTVATFTLPQGSTASLEPVVPLEEDCVDIQVCDETSSSEHQRVLGTRSGGNSNGDMTGNSDTNSVVTLHHMGNSHLVTDGDQFLLCQIEGQGGADEVTQEGAERGTESTAGGIVVQQISVPPQTLTSSSAFNHSSTFAYAAFDSSTHSIILQPVKESDDRTQSGGKSTPAEGIVHQNKESCIAPSSASSNMLIGAPPNGETGSDLQNGVLSQDAMVLQHLQQSGTHLMVVGNSESGTAVDNMTYIYIECDGVETPVSVSEAETSKRQDAIDTITNSVCSVTSNTVASAQQSPVLSQQTITLNSADGTALHTLSTNYSQQLESNYNDIMLVEDGSSISKSSDEGQMVLVSVVDGMLKLESAPRGVNVSEESVVQLPSHTASETLGMAEDGGNKERTTGGLSMSEVLGSKKPGKRGLQQNRGLKGAPAMKTVKLSSGQSANQERTELVNNVQMSINEICRKAAPVTEAIEVQKEGAEIDSDNAGMPSIEERLATRDSLLPPRRPRRVPHGNSSTNFRCEDCGATFNTIIQYHGHLHAHRRGRTWRCNNCELTFATEESLRTHESLVHEETRPFSCQHCKQAFFKSLHLEDHIRAVHNKEKRYMCTYCPRGFYRPYDLKMHLNIHLGIKSNVCYVCGRQFSHPSNLIRHQRVHTGVKPYVCQVCGKRFNQVSALMSHKHSNSQNEVGICPMCPCSFTSVVGLRKHMKVTHKKNISSQEATKMMKGKKKDGCRCYYCTLCGMQFLFKTDLVVHEKKVHETIGEHRCTACSNIFTTLDEIKTHACLSPEELARKQRLAQKEEETDGDKVEDTLQSARVKDASEMAQGDEEEYLVMYITPEGESVTYVMKKNEKITSNKVLQINANPSKPESEVVLPSNTSVMSRSSSVTEGSTAVGGLFASQDSNLGTTPHGMMTLSKLTAAPSETILINVNELETSLDVGTSTVLDQRVTSKSNIPSSPTTIILSGRGRPGESTDPSTYASISSSPIKGTAENGNGSTLASADIKPDPDSTEEVTTSTPHAPAMDDNPTAKSSKSTTKLQPKPNRKPPPVRVNPLECADCGKTFQKRWNYQEHIGTHNVALHKYKCGECGRTFAYRSTLNKHVEKHKGTVEVHQCKLCDKIYTCVTSYKKHYRRDHSNIRRFSCEECARSFYNSSDYKYHMRLHMRERPYICFSCGKAFTHVSHLHRHERIHTGERPHKCPYCPKAFIQSVTLKVHLKKHERQKRDHVQTQSASINEEQKSGANDLANNTNTSSVPITSATLESSEVVPSQVDVTANQPNTSENITADGHHPPLIRILVRPLRIKCL